MNCFFFRRFPCLTVLLFLCASSFTHGATLNVPSSRYPTIQSGIDAAQSGDTVLVADGTYTGNGNRDLDFLGKSLTVKSEHGPTKTIIDCQGTVAAPHRGFYIHRDELVVVIDGFTVEHGVASGSLYDSYGGGIFISGSRAVVTLANCNFDGNTASSVGYDSDPRAMGGGAYILGSGVTVTNCTFSENTASGDGGGLASGHGGGAYIADIDTPAVLANCTFHKNTARGSGGYGGFGGGIFYSSAKTSATLTNCIIDGNTADGGGGPGGNGRGGGVLIYGIGAKATSHLTNCTLSGNTASGRYFSFGGAVFSQLANLTLTNCIAWGDIASSSSDEIYFVANPGDSAIMHSDIQGGYTGVGNINTDPKFVNATIGDLHLQSGSPCIGAGTHNGAPATDLDGNPRPNPPSMGAYDLPASATITAFTVTPNQVTAPGPPTTFEVDTTGEFRNVVVTCDPQNFTGRAPVFALTQSGNRWTGTFPTAFLRLARVNPLPLVAIATRQDGSTATATATLGLQQSLPLLGLSLTSNASTVQRNQTVKLTVTVTNPTQAPVTAATLKVSLPAGVTFQSSPNLQPDGSQGLSWSFLLPAGGGFGSGQASTNFVVQVNNNVAANSTLAFTATVTAPNFQSASRTAMLTVRAGTVPLHIFADESQGFGLLRGEATNVDGSKSPPLQADLTTWAEVTNPLGTQDLQMWFEVVDLRSSYGQTVVPKSGSSPGAVLAGLNLIAPDIHPIYSAQNSFRQVYDTVDMTVMLTPKSFVASLTDYLMAGMAVILPDKGVKAVNVARLGIKLYTGVGAIARIGALWAPPPTSRAAALSAVGKTAKELAGMTDADKQLIYIYAKEVYGAALPMSLDQFTAQLSKELNVLQLVKDLADVITWSVQTKGEPMKVRFVATP